MFLQRLIISCFVSIAAVAANAQMHAISLPDSGAIQQLTVSYTLTMTTNKKNGHAESYNGSIKTIFISNNKIRSRLVALMRIQSVFYFKPDSVVSVKETGKERIRNTFTASQWHQLNNKYTGNKVELLNDSIDILNYKCKKALITLNDGRQLTAYYTPLISNNSYKLVEPAFVNIPGFVLQYEYVTGNAVLQYKASSISFAAIDPQVFRAPQ